MGTILVTVETTTQVIIVVEVTITEAVVVEDFEGAEIVVEIIHSNNGAIMVIIGVPLGIIIMVKIGSSGMDQQIDNNGIHHHHHT